METAIKVSGLDFYNGEIQSLFGINLDIKEKQITGLIGPSGSGKSTLLRTFNRIYELHPGQKAKGEISLFGDNILERGTDINSLRAKVGMVFQKPTPFPMSILKNITFALKMAGVPKNLHQEKIEEHLKDAALWDEVKDKLHKPATGLSGGQQQRLCIARTLATEPDVLLLDEPTSALDPASTKKIEKLLVNLKNKYTVILVTHNLRQAMRVADETCFMIKGEIIEYRNTKDFFESPQDQRTKEYISHE